MGDSSTAGCVRPLPAFGLDEESAEIDGLDDGILDGDVVLVGSIDGTIAVQRLSRFLQSWLSCLCGIDRKLLRPRWQPEMPNLPAVGVSWGAFGVTNRKADVFAAQVHFGEEASEGDGHTQLQRHEEFDVLVSFYGPQADSFATAVRDNAQLGQNREKLFLANMGLIEIGDMVAVPSLVKDKWLYRQDITVRLRRAIVRDYKILNIESAKINLHVGEAVSGGTLDSELQINRS